MTWVYNKLCSTEQGLSHMGQVAITVIPNKVNIYQRYEGSPYQARIKLDSGEWYRTTTKKRDLDEARERSIEIYYETRTRQEQNLPPVSKTCSSVAKYTISIMNVQTESGRGKVIYKDYIKAINQYFIPFFGKHSITKITPQLLDQFDSWRSERMGKEPASSTLNTHNSSFNRIFEVAKDQGWIVKSQIPLLKNKGRKSQTRPTFSFQEYRLLHRRMREWSKTGVRQKTQMKRELLRDYVLILSNTGIRHGTEMMNLKWKHVTWFENEKGERFIQFTVSGKTGNRQLIGRHSVVTPLKRIQSRFEELNSVGFDDLLKSKCEEYVFRLSDGTIPKQLDKSFTQFLENCDLLYGSTSENPRTLYSLRHFYATYQLFNGRNIHKLAIQMGTSVGMLEQHYSKLTPMLMAKEFAGG